MVSGQDNRKVNKNKVKQNAFYSNLLSNVVILLVDGRKEK